jgi:hypothetical protein
VLLELQQIAAGMMGKGEVQADTSQFSVTITHAYPPRAINLLDSL